MVSRVVWWVLSTASALLSGFFLFLGINLCQASFQLGHPHQFILTFFASNLIILISAVILAGVIVRVIARLRHIEPVSDVGNPRLTSDAAEFPEHSALVGGESTSEDTEILRP